MKDTQVLEEDNKYITGIMDPESEEEQMPTQHKTRPRMSRRVTGHNPQYSGLICDEDILSRDKFSYPLLICRTTTLMSLPHMQPTI